MENGYRKKAIDFIKNNYVYITVILVASLVMVLAMILDNVQPFGDNFPLKGNGFIQNYSKYVDTVRSVKKGTYFDSLNYSVGLAFDNYDNFLLLRPWLYIIYFFTPKALFITVFFMYFFVNYVAAGPVFVYYLTHRRNGRVMDKKDPRLILFGLGYVLSAYSIGYFIYCFKYLIFIPLIFLGIEKLVYDKKSKLYILLLAYFMATDAYYAFILCIFAVIYFVIQKHNSFKGFIINSVRFGVSSVFSAGLAAAFLIPYFLKTRNSPYISGDGTTPSPLKWFSSIFAPLFDYRVANKGMTTSTFEYRANLYCGIFILLLIPAYMLLKDIDIWTRIKYVAVVLIIYLGFDNQFINYVFHGFHYQWQVPNRFSVFFMFFIMLMVYEVVIRLESINKKALMIGVIAVSLILTITYLIGMGKKELPNNNSITYILSFSFIGVYIILFLLYAFNKIKGKKVYIIYLIAALEVVISSVPTIKSSISYNGSKSELEFIENTEKLTKRHPDMKTPFVITERPGENFDQNISYMTGTHSLSFYTSASYKQHFDLYYRWGMLFSQNITYYSTGSPLSDMMLHVKYHTANSEKYEAISPYVPVDKEGNVVLYENPYYLPLGIVIDSSKLKEWNEKSQSYTNYYSVFERDNAFANAFGTGDIYNDVEISRVNSEEELGDEGSYYMVEEDSEGNALYTFYINSDIEGALYMQIAQAPEYIGTAVKGEPQILYYYVQRTLNLGEYDDVKIAVWDTQNFKKLYDVLSENTMTDLSYENDGIYGKVAMPEDGMLFLSMPNIPGLTAVVDGSKIEIKSFMDGVGLELPAGYHKVEIRYTSEGVIIGWSIGISSALILLVVYETIKKRNEKDEENDSISSPEFDGK